MSFAFELATHDPQTAEKGKIGTREVFANRFTLTEVTDVQAEVARAINAAIKDGKPFTVKDEIAPVAKALTKRVADGGKAITPAYLLDTLSEEQYRALLVHYAPSLLNDVGGEGKA